MRITNIQQKLDQEVAGLMYGGYQKHRKVEPHGIEKCFKKMLIMKTQHFVMEFDLWYRPNLSLKYWEQSSNQIL